MSQKKNERRLLRPVAVVILVAITAFIYWPLQVSDFVNYDDEAYVTANRHVRSGLTREGIAWAFTDKGVGHWHPFTWISHMLDVELYSLHAGGHHWTNVLIHLANVVILSATLNSLTGCFWRSLAVGALFAVHPLNCESVAWISERKNVLSAFFFLLALWSYGKYARSNYRLPYSVTFFLFVCAVLTKPVVVTLPFVLLLLDYWPLARLRLPDSPTRGADSKIESLARLILEKIPLLAIVPFSIFMTVQAARFVDTVASLEEVPLHHRFFNAALSYVSYLGKALWPRELAVFYPYPTSFSLWKVGGALLLIVALSSVALFLSKRRPYLTIGWLWYLGTLVPVIGIVQAGGQSMADRYAYLSLIGIFIAAVWFAADLLEEFCGGEKTAATVFLGILIVFSLITRQQTLVWQNSITLFSHTLSITTNNHVAHSNLGKAFLDAGMLNEAKLQYEQALNISPSAEGHNNLGMVLAELGLENEAMRHYEAALAKKPTYAEVYNNIGVIHGRKGNLDGAIDLFDKALSFKKDYADAYNNLGFALAMKERHEEAIPYLQAALNYAPDHPRARRNIVKSLMAQKKWDEAIRHLEILHLHLPADKELQRLLAEAEANRKIP